jgi:predicted DNA-binding transcriptional regulator AlpA
MADTSSLDLASLVDQIVQQLAERMRLDTDRLIDLEELAARVGVSRRGASGLVARGELPPGNLIGGVRRWDWSEVRKFLATRQGRKTRRGRGRRGRGRILQTTYVRRPNDRTWI